VGRPGYVDTRRIRERPLFAPADRRGHDAIWLQYLRESFVLDLVSASFRSASDATDERLVTGPI
jgi:hypothetical protein